MTIGFNPKLIIRTALSLAVVISPYSLKAQKDTINYDINIRGLVSTGVQSPFWLHSRQFGLNSENSNSFGVLAGIEKPFNHNIKLFDYGFKGNVLLRQDVKTNIYIHELYGKLRLSVFDLIVGSREEYLGNQDSTLSVGGILFSQNARPMPKITIGIEHFTTVPYTFGYLEIKGALSHGWFTDNSITTGMLLHHKYIYLRAGGKLPVHLQYGLDHVAQWGGYVIGSGLQPAGFSDYKSIFLGHSGGSGGEAINALGNHIISQSLRLDLSLSDINVAAYWQNISEDNPVRFIGNTMNASDGLWGISIRSLKCPFIKGILYEFLNTTDQSGPYHDKDGVVYGGGDNYFTNYVYREGWTYFSKTIGTPFISIASKSNSITNTRVQVHHVGVEGDLYGYNYRAISSFCRNYGTYSDPFPQMIQNTSILLEVNKQFPKLMNLDLGCSIGADFGKLYGNSVGCMISIRKKGNLFSY